MLAWQQQIQITKLQETLKNKIKNRQEAQCQITKKWGLKDHMDRS